MKRFLMALAMAFAFAAGGGVWAQDTTNDGAYDALSPGEQMIVDAIHGSQTEGGTLTKDDIAATKDETGWGDTYNQMHEDGLVTERNLGLAISKHVAGGGPGGTGLGIATGAGTETAVGTPQGTDGQAFGQGVAGANGGATTVTTGAGATVTTGNGGTVTTGFGGTVTTGAGAASGVSGGAAAQTPAASVSQGAGGSSQGLGASDRGR